MDFSIKFDDEKPNFPEMILYEKNGSWTNEKLLTCVLNRAVKKEHSFVQPDAKYKHEIIVNLN